QRLPVVRQPDVESGRPRRRHPAGDALSERDLPGRHGLTPGSAAVGPTGATPVNEAARIAALPGHGSHGTPPTGSRTLIRTVAEVPSGSTWPPVFTWILTGTSCVTFTKLPEAFWLGSSENVPALAGVIA